MSRQDPRSGDEFASFLGMRHEEGGIRLTIRPELLNVAGRLLGPVGFALVDYGMAAVLFDVTDEHESFATTNISINFLTSASSGDVICTSRADRRGRRAAFLSSELRHEDGRLLATAIGTFAIFTT